MPVLIDTDGTVIDESLDIMLWALRRSDPEQWLAPERDNFATMHSLIRHFDEHLKGHLDRYKYPTRFADVDVGHSRGKAVVSLQLLESRLQSSSNEGRCESCQILFTRRNSALRHLGTTRLATEE